MGLYLPGVLNTKIMNDKKVCTERHSVRKDHEHRIKKPKYELTESRDAASSLNCKSQGSLLGKTTKPESNCDGSRDAQDNHFPLESNIMSSLINASLFSHDVQSELRKNYAASSDYTNGCYIFISFSNKFTNSHPAVIFLNIMSDQIVPYG